MPGTEPWIPLKGGPAVRASVVLWLLETSERLAFTARNGELLASPKSAITQEDDRFLRQHRDEVLAAVAYCERIAAQPL